MNTKSDQLDFLRRLIKALRAKLDFIGVALVVAGFLFVAVQRLGDVPLPDSDESMMLQISYEMLHHGKLAFPMKGFYGGNIENAWHSLTPVYFVTLSGFMKLFGWGLAQGRAFNLITAAFLLLMVYLAARKIFAWPVGLIAVLLLISDPLFLERSRLLRNDLIAAAFGLLAFYLYERAEELEGGWYYFASGLAAGAAVMCHTNLLYMLCVIAVLMLLRDGWRLLKRTKPYLFAAGALVAMAYEIIFAIVDYRNFRLQTSKDDVHFRVLEHWGWWQNLRTEPERYAQWFDAAGERIAPEITLLRIFLFLTIVAIIYLMARSVIQIRRGNAMSEPRVRVLVATLVVALFFAIVTQRKVTQYVVHLAPWFALCVAVLLSDGVAGLRRLRELRWNRGRLVYGAAMLMVALLAAGYGYEMVKQNRNYLAKVRNPDQATFGEIKSVLRSVVPDGLCPVSIASGYLWLAFPEYDHCYFAYMEAPLDQHLDLDGKEYALIIKPKFQGRLRKLTGGGFEKYHLLAELTETPYGTLDIYYTGADPRYLAQAPRRYYFFGRQRGHVSGEQVAAGREIWTAGAKEVESCARKFDHLIDAETLPAQRSDPSARDELTRLCVVELEPGTAYQVIVDASPGAKGELVLADDAGGTRLQTVEIDGEESEQHLEEVFKTASGRRLRLAIRLVGDNPGAPRISRVSIREIAPISTLVN